MLLLLPTVLLLGGYAAQPAATPEATISQEIIDIIHEKYGLEPPPSPSSPITQGDWGVSIKTSPSVEV